MECSVQVRYSVAFKRQVVGELESGRFRSIEEARGTMGSGAARRSGIGWSRWEGTI